jgi:hypothetical protein
VYYWALTAAVLASFVLVWRGPAVALADVYEPGPGTNEPSLIVSLVLLWCLLGIVLWWLTRRGLTADTLPLLVGAVVVSLLYLALLRERVFFGDYRAYMGAARAMLAGAPLPDRYLYPPFWAFLLSLIQRAFGGGAVGDGAAMLFIFVANHLSVVGFFILGSLFLRRCGLSRALASLLMLAAVVVSAPVLRNMVYLQVNLILVDLVLAGVLVLRRSVVLSALFFALATHLKVVPLAFVPVFIYRREYRWVVLYGLFCAGVAWMTTLTGGVAYYREFIENLGQWHPAGLRSCSLYSFFERTRRLLPFGLPAGGLFNATRVVLGGWAYALSYLSIRGRVFAEGPDARTAAVINGLVPLWFLLPIVAPTVWVHHLVVIIIPALLVLGSMRGARNVSLWVAGYFFTFLLPAFDFYPWSYLRLAGWLALFAALSIAVRRPRASRWIRKVDRAVSAAVAGAVRELAAAYRGRAAE